MSNKMRKLFARTETSTQCFSDKPRLVTVFYLADINEAKQIYKEGKIVPKFSDEHGNYIIVVQYAEPVYQWPENKVIFQLLLPEDELVINSILPSQHQTYRTYGDAYGAVSYRYYNEIKLDRDYIKKRIQQVNMPFEPEFRDVIASFENLKIGDSVLFKEEDNQIVAALVIDKDLNGVDLKTVDDEVVFVSKNDVTYKIAYQRKNFVWKNAVKKKKVLMIIAEKNFQDTEYLVPRKVFENNNLEVETASTSNVALSMNNKKVVVDFLLNDVDINRYIAVVVVGGSGSHVLADTPEVINILRKVYENGGIVAGICHGVISLAKAGLLKNREATTYPDEAIDIIQQFGAKYVKVPVVREDRVITADAPPSSVQFAKAVVEALKDNNLL